MRLETVKTLSKNEAQRLSKAGIRTAEDLALVDVGARKVEGLPVDRLRTLRKDAQVAIFQAALERVRAIAVTAVENIEEAVEHATDAALKAAATAQERAQEAIEASQAQARVLARVAAQRTREAAYKAQQEYASLVDQVQKATPEMQKRLKVYEEKAERAAQLALSASGRAASALERLSQDGQKRLAKAAKGGKSLVQRLRSLTEPAPKRRPARKPRQKPQ